MFSHVISVCFENIPYKATYSVKKGVWNDPQMMRDCSKPQHKWRKLALYNFLKITMPVQDWACVCVQKATCKVDS